MAPLNDRPQPQYSFLKRRRSHLPRDLQRLRATVVQLFEGAGKVSRDRVGLAGALLLEPRGERHGVAEPEVHEGVVRPEKSLEYLLFVFVRFPCGEGKALVPHGPETVTVRVSGEPDNALLVGLPLLCGAGGCFFM